MGEGPWSENELPPEGWHSEPLRLDGKGEQPRTPLPNERGGTNRELEGMNQLNCYVIQTQWVITVTEHKTRLRALCAGKGEGMLESVSNCREQGLALLQHSHKAERARSGITLLGLKIDN